MPINSRDRNWSTPAFPSSFGLGEPFIPRRRSTTDKLFSEFQQSPLHDLAPLAQPGITTRVTRNNSVAISMDALADPFEFPTAETVVTMEGGLTAPLVWAAGVAVLSSFQNGFSSANMNTAAEVMRADLGVPSTDAANDTTWGFCVSVFCLGALVGCSMGASLADSARARFSIGTTRSARCSRPTLSIATARNAVASGGCCSARDSASERRSRCITASIVGSGRQRRIARESLEAALSSTIASSI